MALICFAGSGTYSNSVEDLKTYFTDGLCCKETEVTQHEMVSLRRGWEVHYWMFGLIFSGFIKLNLLPSMLLNVGRTGAVVSVANYGPRGPWFET